MTAKIISDISDFIFVSDTPKKVDAIFLPGGSHPNQPEYAASLYCKDYAQWLIVSGGISVKSKSWPGVKAKADIYSKKYKSDCEFLTDVLIKNGVPKSAIIGENKSGHTRAMHFSQKKLLTKAKSKLKRL